MNRSHVHRRHGGFAPFAQPQRISCEILIGTGCIRFQLRNAGPQRSGEQLLHLLRRKPGLMSLIKRRQHTTHAPKVRRVSAHDVVQFVPSSPHGSIVALDRRPRTKLHDESSGQVGRVENIPRRALARRILHNGSLEPRAGSQERRNVGRGQGRLPLRVRRRIGDHQRLSRPRQGNVGQQRFIQHSIPGRRADANACSL